MLWEHHIFKIRIFESNHLSFSDKKFRFFCLSKACTHFSAILHSFLRTPSDFSKLLGTFCSCVSNGQKTRESPPTNWKDPKKKSKEGREASLFFWLSYKFPRYMIIFSQTIGNNNSLQISTKNTQKLLIFSPKQNYDKE